MMMHRRFLNFVYLRYFIHLVCICILCNNKIWALNSDHVMKGIKVEPKTRWLSFEDLTDSFKGKEPMAVGFDVDDTVLFSSPSFYYWGNKFSKIDPDYFKNIEFWHAINNEADQFSMPKKMGTKLIDFHKSRGDKIFFITARWKTEKETVTKTLSETFSIKLSHPVIFTGSQKKNRLSKVEPIKNFDIKIYYGDADEDMICAKEAKIRGIRIMRAPNSGDQPLPVIGALGEEVLINSMF